MTDRNEDCRCGHAKESHHVVVEKGHEMRCACLVRYCDCVTYRLLNAPADGTTTP